MIADPGPSCYVAGTELEGASAKAAMTGAKTIGVLTSGGDCSGLNAVIRAVVRRAVQGHGWRVLGIQQGTQGLLTRPVGAAELTLEMFKGDYLRMGGTLLGTANFGDPFAFRMMDGSVRDRSAEVVAGYRELGLDALIGIGGDGSLAILRRLAVQGGWNFVGIPKTIDNDVGLTDGSVGYATAVDVATEALDRLQPTAASHHRVMVLEVMGRGAGHIALAAGIAGGADAILIPEIPWSVAGLVRKIDEVRDLGRGYALVMVAEAARLPSGEAVAETDGEGNVRFGGVGHQVSALIEEKTMIPSRVTVLGYVQRGGAPSPQDRLFASSFGVCAVDLVAEGKFDRMVAWSHRACVDVPLEDVLKSHPRVEPDGELARTARGLGIYLSEEAPAPRAGGGGP